MLECQNTQPSAVARKASMTIRQSRQRDESASNAQSGRLGAASSGGISPAVIVILKVALAVFMAISVLAQVWALPLIARRSAQDAPQYAPYATGYLLAVIATLACFEIGLVAVWQLASLAGRGAVFTHDALIWVDIIIACVSIAALIVLGVFIHTAWIAHITPLVVPLGALLVALGLFSMLMLVIVLRALLISATAQHDELEAVI